MRYFYLFLLPLAAIATGCSTHPIPDDRTGLGVYDIAHKVRCEAREAVEKEFFEAGFDHTRLKMVSDDDAELKATQEKFSKIWTPKIASIVAERDRLAAQERLIVAQIERLSHRLEGASQAALAEHDRAKRNGKVLTVEQKWFLENVDAKNEFDELRTWVRSREINDRRIRQHNSSSSLLERNRINDLQDIARRNAMVVKHNAELRRFLRHTFAFALRFEIEEINDARVNTADFTRPVTLGTVTLGLTFGDKKQRKAKRELRVAASFGELLALEKGCRDAVGLNDDGSGHVLRYPIRGRIGLGEVINQYMTVLKNKLTLSNETGAGLTYSGIVTFTTTVDGSIKPSAIITRSSGDKFTGSSTILGQRQDIHEVTIALVPPKSTQPADADKTINVRIISNDSLLQDN